MSDKRLTPSSIVDERISTLVITLCIVVLAFVLVSQNAYAQEKSKSSQSSDPSSQTGIDPTDIRTRIEAAYTYNERSNNVIRHHLNLRLDRAFLRYGMSIRLEVPVIYADISQGNSEGGLGDLGVTYSYRYKDTQGHSALVGGEIRFETATEDALGDGTTKLTGVWVNSWREKQWLLAAVALAAWSESGDYDAVGVVPFIGYQPMKKYISYASIGLPVIRNLDDDQTATSATLRFGRVFGGGSVAYFGTRIDLSGNSDDELVVTIGYRYML
jgi:hypothetical protein